jgi:hypothetical protein
MRTHFCHIIPKFDFMFSERRLADVFHGSNHCTLAPSKERPKIHPERVRPNPTATTELSFVIFGKIEQISCLWISERGELAKQMRAVLCSLIGKGSGLDLGHFRGFSRDLRSLIYIKFRRITLKIIFSRALPVICALCDDCLPQAPKSGSLWYQESLALG